MGVGGSQGFVPSSVRPALPDRQTQGTHSRVHPFLTCRPVPPADSSLGHCITNAARTCVIPSHAIFSEHPQQRCHSGLSGRSYTPSLRNQHVFILQTQRLAQLYVSMFDWLQGNSKPDPTPSFIKHLRLQDTRLVF